MHARQLRLFATTRRKISGKLQPQRCFGFHFFLSFPLFFRLRCLWYQWPLPCIIYCETPWKQTPYTRFGVCLTFIEGREYKYLQRTFSSRSVNYAACLCARIFIPVHRAVLAFIVTCFILTPFLYLRQPTLQDSWWWLCLTHRIIISHKTEV